MKFDYERETFSGSSRHHIFESENFRFRFSVCLFNMVEGLKFPWFQNQLFAGESGSDLMEIAY